MAFINPDPTFGHQADRVYNLYQKLADLRDKFGTGDSDARHVNLNNIMMAANAGIGTLRLLHWAKNGGEAALSQALGLAKPEHINLVAEDLLRSSRLFLLVEAQFQIEALLRNILSAIGNPSQKQGFYNVASDLLTACKIPDKDTKLKTMNVGALLRNSMHANGIHHGWKGSDTVEVLNGVEFRFENAKRVECGSWYHIVTALTASLDVVEEILNSQVVNAVALIPDGYAAQKAASSGP